jgi:hypothetical protein
MSSEIRNSIIKAVERYRTPHQQRQLIADQFKSFDFQPKPVIPVNERLHILTQEAKKTR